MPNEVGFHVPSRRVPVVDPATRLPTLLPVPAHVVPFLAVTLLLLSSCAGRPADDATSAPTTSVARPVLLSADDRVEPAVVDCLADSTGMVARYSDREVYAAADPTDAMRVLAVWQTSSGTGSVVQWSRSTDGGETWSAPRAAPINACAGGPVPGALRASDPWVSFGPEGRAYMSGIAWTPGSNGHSDIANALVVLSSGDGGEHWESPVALSVAPVPARAYDNLAVTADPTRPGTVYAATTRGEWPDSATYYGRLGFTRSVDGGLSWSPIRPITPAVDLERIGAPQIVVHPRSGRLYAVYTRRRRGVGSIGVSISDDGGDTWSAPIDAVSTVMGPRVRDPETGKPFVLADDIVQAAVLPASGRLVIAYADARASDGRRDGVSIVWSDDGRHWLGPRGVSSREADFAWLPAITTAGGDAIAVSYFSSPFAARGDEASGASVVLRRFRASGTGFTEARERALDRMALVWPGDYQGLVFAGGYLLAFYGREDDAVALRVR